MLKSTYVWSTHLSTYINLIRLILGILPNLFADYKYASFQVHILYIKLSSWINTIDRKEKTISNNEKDQMEGISALI